MSNGLVDGFWIEATLARGPAAQERNNDDDSDEPAGTTEHARGFGLSPGLTYGKRVPMARRPQEEAPKIGNLQVSEDV